MNSKQDIKTAFDAVKDLDLTGKVFLITGAYSGLGAATTKALLQAGAKVIITGRSESSQTKFAQELIGSKDIQFQESNLDYAKTMDLTSLQSVATFAKDIFKRYEKIDCVISNAGVMNTPFGKTKDGFEIQMGTNVIGHFLLNKILAPKTVRQVWLSSNGHLLVGKWPGEQSVTKAPRIDLSIISNPDETNYDGWFRYQQSKLGDILLAKQFAREFDHLKTCAVHPGVVRTKLGRHTSVWQLLKYVAKTLFNPKTDKAVTPEEGARTQTFCATMPENELKNGGYYAKCTLSNESDASKSEEDAKRLYEFCDEVTKSYQ